MFPPSLEIKICEEMLKKKQKDLDNSLSSLKTEIVYIELVSLAGIVNKSLIKNYNF